MGHAPRRSMIFAMVAGLAVLTSCGNTGGVATSSQRPTGSPTVIPSAASISACPPSSPPAFPPATARLGGTITTVAGGGDNGNGIYAHLYSGPALGGWVPGPYTVTVNNAGVIYIGDGVGVRRVGTDGTISTNDIYVNPLTGTTGVAIAARELPGAPPGQASVASDLLYVTQF